MAISDTATQSHVRNIQQSVQDRDVVKQAPDITVFIDGQNYLTNPYLGDGSGVPVAFNDYITNFSASYDIEALQPTASLTLSVPNMVSHLFEAPGGNHLIETMAEVRVFAKGYYPSPRGNTVYRQVFRGYISSYNSSDDGMHTTINLGCFGALGILEKMLIDMNPAIQSSAAMEVTPMQSVAWSLNPYDQIAFVFLYSSMLDGFGIYSLNQAAMNQSNPYYQAIQQGFVSKWQALLYDLAQDVHIYGKTNVTNLINTITSNSKYSVNHGQMSKAGMADNAAKVGVTNEPDSATANDEFYNQLRYYTPDMSFSSIQLLNSQPVSRLERLRYIVNLIGFEAYQDIDGGIIIKPPLYNLDVTNVSNPDAPQLDNTLIDIYEQNNPFVVQYSEVSNPSYNEDEAGIRATRMLMRGSLSPQFQMQGTEQLVTTVEDIDIAKMNQFGLRTEAPHNAAWFRDGDAKALYAYCATELARANRDFRTMSFTIPLRPELKLGFPMYLPWKDMYGYIKGVTINYQQGGDATMNVTLTALRRRPMYPVQQQVPSADGTTSSNRTLLTPQKNLVLQWTKAPESTTPAPEAQLTGQLASLPVAQQMVFDQQIQTEHYRRQKIGNSWGPATDTTAHCWRVQPDTNGIFTTQRQVAAAPAGTTASPANDYYLALRTIRPFTDGKGYELVGYFPWGRFDSLKNAIFQFTINDTLATGDTSSAVTATIQPVSSDTEGLQNSQAFLFMGLANPSSTPEAASQLASSLEAQAAGIANFKVFELTYDSTNTPSTLGGLNSVNDPGVQVLSGSLEAEVNVQARATAFLTGAVPPSDVIGSILQSVQTTDSET